MTRRFAIAGGAAAAGFAASLFAIAGCSSSSSNTNDHSAPTPATVTTAASSANPPNAASGLGGDYCAVVIKVNTDAGTMVNKTFVSTDKWTRAQVKTLVDFTLTHSSQFLSITPPALKSAVEVEMQWMQAIKNADYDLHTTNVPAGIAGAMGKITNYQIDQCGISYG